MSASSLFKDACSIGLNVSPIEIEVLERVFTVMQLSLPHCSRGTIMRERHRDFAFAELACPQPPTNRSFVRGSVIKWTVIEFAVRFESISHLRYP